MRWTRSPRPNEGDRRIVSFFAWFPYDVGDESRWLEAVTVEQVCRRCYAGLGCYANRWHDVRFVDSKPAAMPDEV